MARGRPSKLVSAQPLLLDAISRGLTYKEACAFAGISYQTFWLWRDIAKAELERVAENPRLRIRKSKKPYVDFYLTLQRAEAQAEYEWADVMVRAAKGGEVIRKTTILQVIKDGETVEERSQVVEETLGPDWRAAESLLTKRKAWRERVENLNIDITDLTDEELQRVVDGDDITGILADRLEAQGEG